MKRIALTDGTGAWFDAEKAWDWVEGTEWDGRNQISLSTGSQWSHERLYRTPGDRYILKKWNSGGGIDEYELVDAATAAAWMIRNKVEIEKPKIHELESEIAKLEIK
nr:hypothetical protein [uncultured Rhodopila sp.]